MYVIPESDSQWQDVDECIDLEDTEKEDSEVLKGLGEEVPEQTKVGGLVRDRKTADIEFEYTIKIQCVHAMIDMQNHILP